MWCTFLITPADLRLHSKVLLKFEGYRCTVLVANGNNVIIGNSQTAKQMKDSNSNSKDLHFKYEISFERLKCSQQNSIYNSVG